VQKRTPLAYTPKHLAEKILTSRSALEGERRIGQRQQARAELSAAIELYRAMDMTFWLPQAEATLAQMA
jgi:hypothetical protein